MFQTESMLLRAEYRMMTALLSALGGLVQHRRDDEWSMGELVHALTDRRYTERTIAYAESHDQVRRPPENCPLIEPL